jgi:hypothetical protein
MLVFGMEDIHKKFINEMIEAEKKWTSADHFIYVTMPVVKDERLLLRALEVLYKGLVINISAILKFEYLYKRINLSQNTRENLETFFKKCSKGYGLNELEKKILKEIMELGKRHKESEIEFPRKGRIIILNGTGSYELNLEELKEFLRVSRKLLENTNRNFGGVFRKV